jgi:hypothetical protein
MLLYGLLSIAFMIATWPYLWENPPVRFLQVFQFMSDNPTVLPVLFSDQLYRAYELPRRYLSFYLFFTLTEVTWPLFLIGLFAAYRKLKNNQQYWIPTLLMAAWFLIPFLYAVIRRPPDFDGMRHFLFILPPIFIFMGFAFELLFDKIKQQWVNIALVAVLLAPGMVGMVQLHPYEYTYYNVFIGGTSGAFRHYETDYWLTCYKEAVEQLEGKVASPSTLYVHREAYVAAAYASSKMAVLDERGNQNQIHSGAYVLINTRSNEDLKTFRDAPSVLSIGRAGAVFCVIKRIP